MDGWGISRNSYNIYQVAFIYTKQMLLKCLGTKTKTKTCLHKKSSLCNLFAEALGTSLEYTGILKVWDYT